MPKNQKPSNESHYTPLHSIPQLSTSFRNIPQCSLGLLSNKEGSIHFQPIKDCLLHHIKCHSSPFSKILLHPTTFHHVPLHSILWKKISIPFQTDQEHSTALRYTWFQYISQHCTPFLNISPCSVAFHSMKESSICVETTQELYTVSHFLGFYTKSTKLQLTPQNFTTFCSVPFWQRRNHSYPKQSLSLYGITVHPIPLHSTTFYSIPQYSSTLLCFSLSQRRHHSLRKRSGDI